MKSNLFSLILLVSSQFSLFAQQSATFIGRNTTEYNNQPVLSELFHKFKIFHLESSKLKQFCSASEFSKFELDLENEKIFNLNLIQNDIRSADYKLIVGTDKGDVILPKGENITYMGYTEDAAEVRMTINDGFVVGYFKYQNEAYYLEPLARFVPSAAPDRFVFYNVKDVIPNPNLKCGVTDMQKQQRQTDAQTQATVGERSVIVPEGCVNVNLAIASLFDMYTTYGNSTVNVTNQTISVLNNVITDYDNDFDKVVNYTISANYVSTSATSALDNAITNTTNGNLMLCNFTVWGSGGNFGVSHDLGSLWTDRNFSGSTVGLAFVGGFCTPSIYQLTPASNDCAIIYTGQTIRYNLLEDFTGTMSNLRNMVSHEYGHNWNCTHDAAGSPNIMAPSVNGSVSWSGTSVSSLNTHEASTSCNFGTTALVGTPNAKFTAAATECINRTIPLNSSATRGANSWSWSMPDGTPASAATQNTSVSYNSTGTKTVSHTAGSANCSGAMSSAVNKTINIINYAAPANTCALATTNISTGGSFGMGIFNVTFGTLNVNSLGAYEEGIAYNNVACQNFTTLASLTNAISVKVGSGNAEGVRVLIDINNDGVFQASESYFTSAAATGVHSGTITLPNTALGEQILRMRVMSNFSGIPLAGGCTLPNYGQVEDYGVILPAALVLPISLTSFTAKLDKERVHLRWETESESNNEGFVVERSVDAKNFNRLGFVAGKGTTNRAQNYSLVDEHPTRGVSYYRLLQKDLDGTIHQVGFTSVEVKSNNYASVFPNPMLDDKLNIVYNNEENVEFIELIMHDLTGKILLQQNQFLTKGLNAFDLDLSDFPKGIYLLNIKKEANVELIKVVR